MMIRAILVAQATLALVCLAEGYTFLQPPYIFHPDFFQPVSANNQRQIPINQGDKDLPCPGDAFFVHPANCSRFYRCVDYSGTGALFSRYLFECPTNHVFVTTVQTCLPGSCPDSPQPVVAPVTPPPSVSSTTKPTVPPTESPAIPAVPETESPFPITPEPVAVTTTARPVTFPEFIPAVPTKAPPVTTLEPPTDINQQEEPCPDKYVQHPDFCNVYTPCKEPSVRYVCPGGTAFDQSRQMCRISAFDDGLCNLKKVFEHPFLLRSENIGVHVRLPDYIYVPTTRTSQSTSTGIRVASGGIPGFPTHSPFQFVIFPTSRPSEVDFSLPNFPSGVDFSLPNFGIDQHAHRPVFSRPAQVFRRPDEASPSSFGTPYQGTFHTFRPIGVEPAPPTTKITKTAIDPRPQGNHPFSFVPFPHLSFQREIV